MVRYSKHYIWRCSSTLKNIKFSFAFKYFRLPYGVLFNMKIMQPLNMRYVLRASEEKLLFSFNCARSCVQTNGIY